MAQEKPRVPLAALGLPGITCWKPTDIFDMYVSLLGGTQVPTPLKNMTNRQLG